MKLQRWDTRSKIIFAIWNSLENDFFFFDEGAEIDFVHCKINELKFPGQSLKISFNFFF